MAHVLGGKNDTHPPIGRWVFHVKDFNHRPTNDDIYASLGIEDLCWDFEFDPDRDGSGCGVCVQNWKNAIGEKPTRFFEKKVKQASHD